MALNDFVRFIRTPAGLNIEIPPNVQQFAIREGYVIIPEDPADPTSLPIKSLWYDSSLGRFKVKDGAGERVLLP